jgi:ABC-type dipeptide/oligopeptide/nickel transport system permease component
VLVHITILIWILTTSNLVDIVFTSDYIEHLLETNVVKELQNTNKIRTYLGHDDDLIAGQTQFLDRSSKNNFGVTI